MRKVILYLLVYLVVMSGASLSTKGQDVRFSQYFTTPHLVNPAFTSMFKGDYQVMLNYRSQWGGIAEVPYRTVAAAADAKVYAGFADCDYIGLGVNLLADRAGALNYGTMQANVTGAYFKSLNGYANNYLSLGFSGGIAQRFLDNDPEAFLDGPETFAVQQFSYFDISTGLLWTYFPEEGLNVYAGAAMFHVNEPDLSHFVSSREFFGGEAALPRRYVMHAGGSLPLGDVFRIRPSFQFMTQGPSHEFDIGAMFQMLTSHPLAKKKGEDNSIYLGAFYRKGDAIIAAARLDYQGYYLTMSYDIGISNLNQAGQPASLEISIAKSLFRNNRPSCPSPLSCPVL